MHAKTTCLMLAVLFVSHASAAPQSEENVDRVFTFSHTDNAQDIRDIYYIILGMSEMRPQTADTEQRILTLRGTAGQIALAEWLFNELDRPANPQSSAHRNIELEKHEFRLSASPPQVARIFYPSYVQTVQELTEVATLVRAITDMRGVFVYNASKALVTRGTPDQVRAAEFLLDKLSKPLGQPNNTLAKYEYKLSGTPEDVVRVFHLTQAKSVQDLTEVATVLRAIGDIRRVFTYNSARAVAVRGTADQAGLAEWLCNRLDDTANWKDGRGANSATHQYRLLNTPEDVVRVFYLTQAGTVQSLHEVATQVRLATKIRRMFPHNASRALAIRGTADQIAVAERLIDERVR